MKISVLPNNTPQKILLLNKNITHTNTSVFGNYISTPDLQSEKTSLIKKAKGFLKKMKEGLGFNVSTKQQNVETVSTAQKEIEEVRIKREKEIQLRQLEVNNTKTLFNQYNEMIINSGDIEQQYILSKINNRIKQISPTTTLQELQTIQLDIKEEINREKMMLELKKFFRKGADFYTTKKHTSIYKLDNIKEIKANPQHRYKTNLKNMAEVYFNNSLIIDCALSELSNISNGYFSDAAQSIKEIFALKSDTTQKWLERIPKLGIIPKALRVGEQIRLTNYVIEDYKDVTNENITKGIVPMINKHEEQYNNIKAYIKKNPVASVFYKKFTDNLLKNLEETHQKRLSANKSILELYSRSGMNLSNTCNNIRKKGIIELATKTAFTLLTFC